MHWTMKDVTKYRGTTEDIQAMEFYRLLMFSEFKDVLDIITLCNVITGFRSVYVRCTTAVPTSENKDNMMVYKAMYKCNIESILALGPHAGYSLFKQLIECIDSYDRTNVDVELTSGIGVYFDKLQGLCKSTVIDQFFDEWTTRSSKGCMSANIM